MDKKLEYVLTFVNIQHNHAINPSMANIGMCKKFSKLRLRILVDVSNVDTTTSILEFKISMPIMISPTGMQKMAHPQDSSTLCIHIKLYAHSLFSAIMTLLTVSISSIEEVALTGP
ncbi:hypothetical protein HN873_035123, partial [Arachis hypogaea]